MCCKLVCKKDVEEDEDEPEEKFCTNFYSFLDDDSVKSLYSKTEGNIKEAKKLLGETDDEEIQFKFKDYITRQKKILKELTGNIANPKTDGPFIGEPSYDIKNNKLYQ